MLKHLAVLVFWMAVLSGFSALAGGYVWPPGRTYLWHPPMVWNEAPPSAFGQLSRTPPPYAVPRPHLLTPEEAFPLIEQAMPPAPEAKPTPPKSLIVRPWWRPGRRLAI